MSQQIINIGPQPNDGLGDDLRVAFEKVNNNFSQLWDSGGTVGTNVQVTNNTISITDTNGNLILSPNGIGNVILNNNTQPRANNLYYLGQPDKRFRGVFVGSGGMNTTGNIAANYFIGDGSMLANLPAGNYSNANVSSYLESGAETSNIITTGNISGNYVLGNGSMLTGITANYNDGNVEALLSSGNVTTDIDTSGNVMGGNIVGGNIYIGNTILTRTLSVGTRGATYATVPLATNNSFNVIGRSGNVVVYTS